MRDIFLITKSKLTWESVKPAVEKAFPDAGGNNSFLLIGKSPKTIQIWFDLSSEGDKLSDRQEDDTDFPAEVKKQIPFSQGFVTNAEYHLEKEICKLISVLVPIYPELHLIDDNDKVFSAEEYLAQAQ